MKMFNKFFLLLLSFSLFLVCIFTYIKMAEAKKKNAIPIELTIKKLNKNPKKYNSKIIQVTGKVWSIALGKHNSMGLKSNNFKNQITVKFKTKEAIKKLKKYEKRLYKKDGSMDVFTLTVTGKVVFEKYAYIEFIQGKTAK